MQKSQVKKGTLVKYDGINRSYLKSYPTAKLTGEYSSTNASVFVEFFNKDGIQVDTAWIGLDYVQVIKFTHQSTIDDLTKKRDELATQLTGFDAAIKALQDLG